MSEQRSTQHETEDSFELNLDQEDGTSLEEVFEEAVAAVDRVEKEHEEAAETAAPEVALETPEPAPEPATASRAAHRRIEELEVEVTSLRERLARTLADFDNFRKRSERDRESALRYALFGPLRDLLEVLDNLERALGAQGSADDLKLGVQMTLRQLQSLLERNAVTSVAAVGQPFDPKIHEAVSRQESDTVSAPTVVAEFQKGYLLHDRLLRPAMVSVAMPVVAATVATPVAATATPTPPAEGSTADAEVEAASAETAD